MEVIAMRKKTHLEKQKTFIFSFLPTFKQTIGTLENVALLPTFKQTIGTLVADEDTKVMYGEKCGKTIYSRTQLTEKTCRRNS